MFNNQNNEIRAGFFVRFAAYVVDMIIVTAATLILRVPFWIVALFDSDNFLVRDFVFDFSVVDIFFYVLQVSYFIILTYKTGSTVGKKLFCLQVVGDNDEKLTMINVIYRETIGRFLSSLVWYVGYIMIGVQNDKMGLHDILSDTKVVYTVKNNIIIEPKAVEVIGCSADNEVSEQINFDVENLANTEQEKVVD